jgi:PleD family two-component response regulator
MDQRTPQPTEPSRQPLILVVDDDSNARLLFCTILEKEGYAVTEAEDGFQALSAFERLHPDLILLDAMMPLMDGFTTCASLRKLSGGSYIPVLMVTALKDDEAIERAFEVGASDYLIKPVHRTVLSHKVRHLLRSKQLEDTLRQLKHLYQAVVEDQSGF